MKTKKKTQTNTYFVNYCLWLVSTGSWANVLGFGINACGFGVCWCYFCDSALEPGAFSARTTHTEKKQSSLTQQHDATTWPIAARPASSQLHKPRRNQSKRRGGNLNSSISTPRPHAAQLHQGREERLEAKHGGAALCHRHQAWGRGRTGLLLKCLLLNS